MRTIQQQVLEFLQAHPAQSFYPPQIAVVSPTGSDTLPSIRRAIAKLSATGMIDKTYCPTRQGKYSFHAKRRIIPACESCGEKHDPIECGACGCVVCPIEHYNTVEAEPACNAWFARQIDGHYLVGVKC